MTATSDITFIHKIDQLCETQWQRLSKVTCPFLRYDFFAALEASGSVCADRGWQPYHLVEKQGDETIGFMPMYLKRHSWGEYVFDWAWAEAYEDHDLDYYPKLVATIPFTPVTSDKCFPELTDVSTHFQSLIDHCDATGIHSWHVLYCHEVTQPLPENVYARNTVQFHWFNRGYHSFDDFLATFSSRKRKNTRKERQSIEQQNLTIRQLRGDDITAKDLEFFYLTYQLTYLKRGHQPHLTQAFFNEIVVSMADNMLLVIASHEQEDVACALFFYDEKQLYGRYWGCTQEFNNLHFELCYYQGIEFCIAHKLVRFNPGTQGEHKIQRGFEPILTYSYHWVRHPAFRGAIKDFCEQEQKHMLAYQRQCKSLLPFKNNNNEKTEDQEELRHE